MKKQDVTISNETLGNLITELRRQNALGTLKAIFQAIKNGEWRLDLVGEDGGVEEIRTARQFFNVLKRYPSQRRNRMMEKLASKKTNNPKSL